MKHNLVCMLVALPSSLSQIGAIVVIRLPYLPKNQLNATPKEAKVHTIEAMNARIIRKTLETVGVANRVVAHIGKAEAIIPQLQSEVAFDLAHIDANKRDYVAYYELPIDIPR